MSLTNVQVLLQDIIPEDRMMIKWECTFMILVAFPIALHEIANIFKRYLFCNFKLT